MPSSRFQRRGRFSLVLITGLVLAVSAARAQSIPDELDKLMSTVVANAQFNGAILVAMADEVVYEKTFGIANIETLENIQKDSQFRLASVAKAFTAMSVMMLKEEGRLSYEDDVRKYLPELPYKGMTIRHFLSHTSGIPDYERLMDEHWDVKNRDSPSRKLAVSHDALDMLADLKSPVDFEPGQKWEYSNTAYVLLSLIVERISGVEFASFLHDRIFEPLGMSHTLLYSPIPDPPVENRVYGYQVAIDGSARFPDDHHYLNGMTGDGEVYSTLRDMLTWDRVLYTDQLVGHATLEEAFTPGRLRDGTEHRYGFGWFIGETQDGRKKVGHGGGWVGFRTHIEREIEDRNTIIILTNHSSFYVGEIRAAVSNIIHGRDYEMPKRSIALAVGEAIRERGLEAAYELYKRLKRENRDGFDFRPRQLNRLGAYYLSKDDVAKAIAVLDINVEQFPEDSSVYDWLGRAYRQGGDLNQAAKSFEKAVALDPENKSAIDSLGELKSM
ncbi:MAG: serine hydrolase [Bacteroidetes bacterium]|nr:serine hydrolase [Bacteroidota bacterium]